MMKVYRLSTNIQVIYAPCEESTKLYLIIGSGKIKQLTLPRVGRFLHSLQQKISRLNPSPQYYWRTESDCDQMYIERAERFPNAWTAEKRMQDAWENREGPLHFEKMSRADYKLYKNEVISQDRAAENAGY